MESSARVSLPNKRNRSAIAWLAPTISILALTAAIWLSSGVFRAGLVEQWLVYRSFDTGSVFYLSTFSASQPNRALQFMPYYFAYLLTPGSFAGSDLLMALLLIGTAFLFYALLRRLFPQHLDLALLAALLYVIYPADRAIVSIRVLNYHWTVFLSLIAFNLLFIYDRRPRRSLLLAMWVVQSISLFTLETGLPLFLIAPVILYWKRPRPLRDMAGISFKWLMVPLLAAAVVLLTILEPKSYQTSSHVSGADTGTPQIVVYLIFVVIAELRSFVQAWLEALDLITHYVASGALLLGLTAAAIASGSMYWLGQATSQFLQPINRRAYGRIVVVGVVLVAIGFSPFLPFAQRSDFERTYLFASMGAVVAVAMVLFLISSYSRRPKILFAGLGAVVVGVALLGAEGRYRQLYEYSVEEQKILEQFTQTMPAFDDKATILIFDNSNTLSGSEWLFAASLSGINMESAVRFLYQNNNIHVWLCYPGGPPSSDFEERCEVGPDGVHLTSSGRPSITVPYSHLIAFDFDGTSDKMTLLKKLPEAYFGQLDAKTYNPDPLIDRLAAPPARAKALLAN